jgi:hypothetical protein
MTSITPSAHAVIARVHAAHEAANREAAQPAQGPNAFVATTEETFAAREAYCRFNCADLADFGIYAGLLGDWLREEEGIVAEFETAGVHEPPATVRFGRSEIIEAVFRNLKSLVSSAERDGAVVC